MSPASLKGPWTVKKSLDALFIGLFRVQIVNADKLLGLKRGKKEVVVLISRLRVHSYLELLIISLNF